MENYCVRHKIVSSQWKWQEFCKKSGDSVITRISESLNYTRFESPDIQGIEWMRPFNLCVNHRPYVVCGHGCDAWCNNACVALTLWHRDSNYRVTVRIGLYRVSSTLDKISALCIACLQFTFSVKLNIKWMRKEECILLTP